MDHENIETDDRNPDFNGRVPVILLVDDEPFNIDLMEQELEGLSLKISTASNGHEALDLVRANPPDMIFLDLLMPGLDGFGVLEQLQSNDDWREIPVVIVSASGNLENIVRGIEMGASDFLPKPFEPAILHARLEAGLRKKLLHDMEHRYLKSLERELEIGREIQVGFLPQVIPQPEGWKIFAHFQAAREVAGDFYDVFEVSSKQMGILVGDVTDKGVGSALYMALYRSLLRAATLADTLSDNNDSRDFLAPEERLTRAVHLVNRYICRFHDTAMFATLFIAILDIESGQICYINAGHDPPYFLRENSILEMIRTTGPMLGVIEDAMYTVETSHFKPGDILVIYSDGIPDAQNASGQMFGGKRFQDLLKQTGESALSIFDAVISSLDEFVGDMDQFDDVTLLIVSNE